MFIEYNANPSNRRTGDCVIRGIAALSGRSWDSVFLEVSMEAFNQKDMPETGSVWGAVLKRNGYMRSSLPDTCPDCYTVKDFCEDYPKGKYLLAIPGGNAHVVAVIDGNYYDIWDSGDEAPQYYWMEAKQ